MAGRGTARSRGQRRRGGAERARRPERGRVPLPARARLRAGLRSKRVAEAARALGLSTTRRAAVAAIVVCTLAFTLAVPLRTYLAQQAEVAEQQELKSALERKVAELTERKAELADPAQVEAEARRRLRFVMPGETPYIVQLPDGMTTAERQAAEERRRATQAWYEQLWTSVTEDRR